MKTDQRYKKHIKVPFGDREPKNLIIEDIEWWITTRRYNAMYYKMPLM